MPQTTVYRPTPTNPTTPAAASVPTASTTGDPTGELLDEIDSVLEENALEVIRTYINRGGE